MVLKVRMILLMMVMSLVGYSQPLIYNNNQISYDGKLVVSAPFSPLDYTPIAWYDSQDLSTITKDGSNYVSQWNDKSGNNYNLQQLTGANQPLYSASNGIVFDGVNDYIKTLSAKIIAKPITLFIVYEFYSATTDGALIAPCEGGDYFYTFTSPSLITQWLNNPNSFITTIATPPYSVIITNYWASSSSEMFINNVSSATGAASTTSFSGFRFGLFASNAYPFKGDIKEIIIYNSELTINERTNVYNYLNAKY